MLLKKVNTRADVSKPHKLVGLAKDLPTDDIEKLLLAGIPINDNAMRDLAVQRSVAVKDQLATKNLPPERLFPGAVKVVPAEVKWTPHAELLLATR